MTIVVEPRATGTLTDRATVTTTTTAPNAADNTATKTITVGNSRGCTRIGTSGNDIANAGYGNDTANGGPQSDTCTTDPGDTRVSCP